MVDGKVPQISYPVCTLVPVGQSGLPMKLLGFKRLNFSRESGDSRYESLRVDSFFLVPKHRQWQYQRATFP